MSKVEGKLTNNGKQLSIVGQDIESIPDNLYSIYGDVEALDFSHNQIKKISNLDKFTKVKTLVLDNNDLETITDFPKFTNLETLWLNNNSIRDIDPLLKALSKLPNLKHLSLLKNPCCPNEFTGNDGNDYKMYRLYVLFKLKGLKHLDSKSVEPLERSEALKRGEFCKVATPDYSKLDSTKPPVQQLSEPEFKPTKQEGKHSTHFGYQKQVYKGLHSEGNRFIKNNDL
jgi:hypothetical protein